MLERLTLPSQPIEGVVLRYGHLYGPGTGADAAQPEDQMTVFQSSENECFCITT